MGVGEIIPATNQHLFNLKRSLVLDHARPLRHYYLVAT